MSTPMTLPEIVAAFEKWDVPYRIIGDPTTHRRDPGHGSWGPVHGTGIHHTGDDAPDTADRRVIREGRSDLPGPLAQFGVNDNGVIDIHSIGRANHFGGGSPAVLDAVIGESYGDYPPATHHHEGSAGAVDGNTHFYGFETYYSGGRKPTAKAYRSLVLANAAIDDHYGWGPKSNIGHKEWSDWKSDPGHVDMKDFRDDVAAALVDGPAKPVVTVDPAVPVERPSRDATRKPLKHHRRPAVSLRRVQRAAKVNRWARWLPRTHRDWLRVMAALKAEGLPNYRQWQLKCGYHGSAADGIPGRESLTKLGRKHGFRVVR